MEKDLAARQRQFAPERLTARQVFGHQFVNIPFSRWLPIQRQFRPVDLNAGNGFGHRSFLQNPYRIDFNGGRRRFQQLPGPAVEYGYIFKSHHVPGRQLGFADGHRCAEGTRQFLRGGILHTSQQRLPLCSPPDCEKAGSEKQRQYKPQGLSSHRSQSPLVALSIIYFTGTPIALSSFDRLLLYSYMALR